MSVASEITRIQGAKADLKTSINAKTDAQHQITTETIDDYADFVDSIQTGGTGTDDSDATLDNNSKLLTGSTAYAKGVKYTGSMANKGSKTFTPSASQQTDTAGYYSSVTVNAMPSGALSTPTINTSTGVVTASVGTSGYLASGTSSTLQLSTQSAQTITPTTTNQTISSGKYLIGTQTISGDENLVAGNIKKDVTIFGVTGTHEGSSTLITKSITENGTYNASSDSADGYSQVTVNVSSGGTTEAEEKDVNYYNYDGTRLYSYTKADFLELQSHPSLPTKTGINYTGWNIDLADCKTLLDREEKLEIGALGSPSDCDLKIIVNLTEEFKNPYVYVGAEASCSINWGDGSSTETYSPTSGTINPNHSYSKGGRYEIKITTSGNKLLNLKSTTYANAYNDNQKTGTLLWGGTEGNILNKVYSGCVEEVWLSNKVGQPQNASHGFSGFTNLKCILCSSNFKTITPYNFYNCRNLKIFNTTERISCFKTNTFKNCYSLERITGKNWDFAYNDGGYSESSGESTGVFENCRNLRKMPTSAKGYSLLSSKIELRSTHSVFKGCYCLTKIFVPPCDEISNDCFADSEQYVKVFDFTSNTSVPILNGVGAFSSKIGVYDIWVPSSLYDDWTVASNWSSLANHIKAK